MGLAYVKISDELLTEIVGTCDPSKIDRETLHRKLLLPSTIEIGVIDHDSGDKEIGVCTAYLRGDGLPDIPVCFKEVRINYKKDLASGKAWIDSIVKVEPFHPTSPSTWFD